MRHAFHQLPRGRAERTIAATRVAVGGFILFAIWLDPAEPQRYAQLTYFVHAFYVAYALVLAAIMWRRSSGGWLPIATHVIDIVTFSVFQYLTLGPSSPFFIYFVFSLFCGAVRWGWAGALGTAPVVLVAFVAMGVSMSRSFGELFELNRFVIRAGYLVMVAALLVYLGRHEARLREEIQQVANWPAPEGDTPKRVAQVVLSYAAGIVRAHRALAVWQLHEEPRKSLACWTDDRTELTTHGPAAFEPLVAGALADASFMCPTFLANDAAPLVHRRGWPAQWRGQPVHSGLSPYLDRGGLASAPFRTERLAGRVFFSAIQNPASEILALVELVAREVGASLDQWETAQQERRLAVAEERIRVARDLHDGVLQSLTAVRLELQNVASDAETVRPDETRNRLLAMERALALEQRELRRFIDGLKPLGRAEASGTPLERRLEDLEQRLNTQWKVPVSIRTHDLPPVLPNALAEAIPRVVQEAVVNAMKHGGPSRVSVDVSGAPDAVRITAVDDGRGFPFRGHYDHEMLTRTGAGPASLRERVTSLGGRLEIDSTDAGARVHLHLPLRPEPT